MRIFSCVSLIALLACGPALAAEDASKPQQIATMRVDGEIEVDPHGAVSSYTLETKIPEELRVMLDRAVGKWSFHPPSKDGKPAIARSKMRVTLAGEFRGDDFAVRVDNVHFILGTSKEGLTQSAPAPMTLVMKPPIKRHSTLASAIVTMAIEVAPSGEILNVAPTQCSVVAAGAGLNMQSICNEYERNATVAIRQWRAEPALGVPGLTKPTTFAMGIHFLANRRTIEETTGKWRGEWRTAYREAPWSDSNAPRIGASDDASNGALVSDGGGLRLREGAIGASL